MSKFSFHALDRPKLSVVRSSERGYHRLAGLREEPSKCRLGTAQQVSQDTSVTSLAGKEAKAGPSGTGNDDSVRVIDVVDYDPRTEEVVPALVAAQGFPDTKSANDSFV